MENIYWCALCKTAWVGEEPEHEHKTQVTGWTDEQT